jgi:hypothetical protein
MLKDYRVSMFSNRSVTTAIKLAFMVERILMVNSLVKIQLMIRTLVVQKVGISMVNPAMTEKLSIVAAIKQTVVTLPKTIVIPPIVVKSVGSWVSAVVSCLAEK